MRRLRRLLRAGGAPLGAAAARGRCLSVAAGPGAGAVVDGETISPFEILGVEHGAPAAAVREAYVHLAKQFHPDRAGSDKAAAERFKEVQAAWYVLGDQARRREFEEHGTLAAPPAAWSPMMWARLRTARPEDGTIIPNWGSEDPPVWLLGSFPVSVLIIAFLWSAKGDFLEFNRDARTIREGGWPCPKCLFVNGASVDVCQGCGADRVVLEGKVFVPWKQSQAYAALR